MCIILSVFWAYLLFIIWIILFPNSVINPGSLVPESWPRIIQIPLVYIPCPYFGLVVTLVTTIFLLQIYYYGVTVIPIFIQEFNMDRKSYRSSNKLRKPEN